MAAARVISEHELAWWLILAFILPVTVFAESFLVQGGKRSEHGAR